MRQCTCIAFTILLLIIYHYQFVLSRLQYNYLLIALEYKWINEINYLKFLIWYVCRYDQKKYSAGEVYKKKEQVLGPVWKKKTEIPQASIKIVLDCIIVKFLQIVVAYAFLEIFYLFQIYIYFITFWQCDSSYQTTKLF